jgi:hypothetical protein
MEEKATHPGTFNDFLMTLTDTQLWFVLFFATFWISVLVFYLIRIIYYRGLPKWNGEGYIIPPKDPINKSESIPKHLRSQIWTKEVLDSKGKKLGVIGFTKNLNVFSFFGDQWNTGYREAREGVEVFEQEWEAPSFLLKDDVDQLECFISIKDIELQSRLIATIKKNIKKWKKVFIICSKSQIMNGELDAVDPKKNNEELPVVLIPFSTELKYD